jgi:hypothetical protein
MGVTGEASFFTGNSTSANAIEPIGAFDYLIRSQTTVGHSGSARIA